MIETFNKIKKEGEENMYKKLSICLMVVFVVLLFSQAFAEEPEQENYEFTGKVMIKDREGKVYNFEAGGLNVNQIYLYEGQLRLKHNMETISELKLTKEKPEFKDEAGNYIYFIGLITDKEGKVKHGMIPIWKHAKIWNKDKKEEVLLRNIETIKFY